MASDQRIYGVSNGKVKKATWPSDLHEFFVDLCVEQTLKGNRPGTHFNKEGWRNIQESLNKKAGLRYDRRQLKNHWDATKKQWKVWNKLIRTNNMKWDPNTQKFGASDEEWINYLQENPDAAPFRSRELILTDKLDTMYDGTVISGESAPPPRRRKLSDNSTTSFLHRTEPEAAKPPDSRVERPCDAVESRSAVTVQSTPGKLNCSIGECIECLDGMDEMEQGSDLYLFALDMFLKKEYREIFLQLKKPSVRVAWLQRLQSVGPPLPLN